MSNPEANRKKEEFKKQINKGPLRTTKAPDKKYEGLSIYEKAVWQAYTADSISRRLAGIGSIKNYQAIMNRFFSWIAEELKKYLIKTPAQNPGEFREWHTAVCKNICSRFNDLGYGKDFKYVRIKNDKVLSKTCQVEKVVKEDVHFGIAQKIVNMAFKYLYCFANLDDELFNYCDCPVDSIIAGIIYNDNKWFSSASDKQKELVNDLAKSQNGGWSGLSEDNYIEFQNIIEELVKKDNCTKLEFDFLHWQAR